MRKITHGIEDYDKKASASTKNKESHARIAAEEATITKCVKTNLRAFITKKKGTSEVRLPAAQDQGQKDGNEDTCFNGSQRSRGRSPGRRSGHCKRGVQKTRGDPFVEVCQLNGESVKLSFS